MDIWTSCAQDWAKGAIESPMCEILDWGGGLLPAEGLPPPSLNGLVLTPDWTMMGSSPNVMAWERGAEAERSVLPGGSPVCWHPVTGGPLFSAASPVMRVGGYRLRSLEVIAGDLVRSPLLHWCPCQ